MPSSAHTATVIEAQGRARMNEMSAIVPMPMKSRHATNEFTKVFVTAVRTPLMKVIPNFNRVLAATYCLKVSSSSSRELIAAIIATLPRRSGLMSIRGAFCPRQV